MGAPARYAVHNGSHLIDVEPLTVKKVLTLCCVVLLASLSALALWVNSWRDTPHGQLSTPAAIIAKVSTWQAATEADASPAAMRASRHKSIGLVTAPAASMAAISDQQIPGTSAPLPVRIYTPIDSPTPLPIIVYFHGGGWVLGDLESHDNLCRSLAAKAGAVVVAVDYRLAPEHIFPAALDDAAVALRWTIDNASALNGDPTRLAVAGDSAGGNIAAALSALESEQNNTSIAAQVLLYPAVDLSNLDRQSAMQFAEGYFLTRERMAWFIQQYVPDATLRLDPRASPLLAADHSGLPPTLVITAEFDPLRDEGEAYAQALDKAGVSTRTKRFDGVLHGFVSMDRWFPEAEQATDLIATFLKQQFAPTAQ